MRKLIPILVAVVISFAAGGFSVILWQTYSSNQQQSAEDRKQVARETADQAAEQAASKGCRAAVVLQLKAPATARWSNEVIDIGPTPNVHGNVDAENGFGALVRNSYSCTQKPDGHGWDAYVAEGN